MGEPTHPQLSLRQTFTKPISLSVNAVHRTWKRTRKSSQRRLRNMTDALHDARRSVRRRLGVVYWASVRAVGRSRKNATRLRRRVYHRGRYTSAGRAMLAVSEMVTSPRDAFQRKRAVLAYNRRHRNPQMDRRDGYALLQPGALPGQDEIVALSRRLFDEKKRRLEAAAGPDTALHAKKWAFMRSVLNNQDLRQHPELVDFALSDALFSVVTNYLGTIPHLNRIDLLYSVAHGGEDAISSQIYHLDPEGMRQAKLFLNLRDVGPDEGPFTFIPAAESRRIVKAVKRRRSGEGEVAMARYLDRELEEVGGLHKAMSVMGPPGSAALVDTSRCLHFGSRVQPGTYRLCLYIQYCGSREHGNMFEVSRHAADPIRYLAIVNSRRSVQGDVSAPHQMG